MVRLLANAMIWYGTHRRGTNMRRTPAKFRLAFREVSFPSANRDSAQICGWLIEARGEAKAVVLLCHGIDSSAQSMLAKAAMLSRNGFACLLFDFRGTGRSGGDIVTLGLREADDVLGAVEYVKGLEELRGLPLIGLGESMGGSAVIRAAAQCDAIRAVISESTYSTLTDALNNRLKLTGPFAKQIAEHCHAISAEKYDVQIPDVSPVRDIAALSPRPLFFIHDNFDVLCPRSQSDRLYEAAKEPKERWDVPYAPFIFAHLVAPREYERRIVDFLSRVVQHETGAAPLFHSVVERPGSRALAGA